MCPPHKPQPEHLVSAAMQRPPVIDDTKQLDDDIKAETALASQQREVIVFIFWLLFLAIGFATGYLYRGVHG